MAALLRFPNINNITISGRLTRDVEMRYSQSNVAVAKLSIAVNHYYRSDAGESKEETSFFDCVAFGKSAQVCQDRLKKASPVLLEGNLRNRSYVDQSGQNRRITEIIIQKVHPLEKDENYVSNYNANHADYPEAHAHYNRSTPNQPAKPNVSIPDGDPESEGFPVTEPIAEIPTEDDVPF